MNQVAGFDPGETILLRLGRLPDWTLVPDAAGQAALTASMAIAGRRTKWAGLSAAEDRAWRAVLGGFGRLGCAPDHAALMRSARCSAPELRVLLHGLAQRDLLLLDHDGAVAAAYPFSRDPTPHRVALGGGGPRVFALCAIDALGMGGMLGRDSAIRSTCAHCGTPIAVRTNRSGHGIARCVPDTAIVWSGLHYAGNCAATSGCQHKLFFCSAPHLDGWCHTQPADGFPLSMPVALQAALALFVPMLAS